MKIQKISAYALYACFIAIAIVLVLFYGVGFNTLADDGENIAPQFTELLLFLMYIMTAVTIVLTIWSFIKSIMTGGVDDAKTGVPGTKVTWATVAILVISFAAGFAFSTSDPVTLTDGTQVGGFESLGSEVMIIAMYIMAVVATVGLILSLVGVAKK